MGRLIHTNDLHNAVMMNKCDWGIFDVTIDNLIEGVVSQVPTVEAIPKDQINKAIEKIEQYICDVEIDTVKAQGMAQALDMFEQALGEDEDGKD